jgi:UDP-N-acetyl-2-amino-2-deoxyglucuronate dehydrogenase
MKKEGEQGPIRFAIVGMGHIGRRHFEMIGKIESLVIAGICDIDPLKLKEFDGVSAFQDLQQLLQHTTPDVVVIASPHHLHFEQTKICLQSGFHVLVEKPMSLRTNEARAMIEWSDIYQRKLWVVKQNRFNTPVFALDHLIKSGKLGKVYFIESHVMWNRNEQYYSQSDWRGKLKEEGGALYTHASHFIDLMVEWGGEIIDACGYCSRRQQQIESEDVGSANLVFSSGAIGSIQWTTLSHQKNFEGSILVIGEKGTIKIGGAYLNQFDYWSVEGYPLPGINWGEDVHDEFNLYQDFGSNHIKVYYAIVEELRSGKKLTVDGMDAIKSIAAIELIYSKIQRIG